MGNKDILNEFVDLHRSEFDMHEPSPELWQKIETHMQDTKPVTVKPSLGKLFLKIAASLTIILSIGTAVYFIQKTKINNNDTADLQLDSASSAKMQEFKEAKNYYAIQVAEEMSAFEHNAQEFPEMISDVKSELHSLDIEYKKLQTELNEGFENEQIMGAMIQNYKFKLELIQHVNTILDQQKSNKYSINHEI